MLVGRLFLFLDNGQTTIKQVSIPKMYLFKKITLPLKLSKLHPWEYLKESILIFLVSNKMCRKPKQAASQVIYYIIFQILNQRFDIFATLPIL